MSLDYDVLHAIMSFIQRRKDLLQIMKTSKTLYRIGAAHLLNFPYTIRAAKSFISFAQYLLSDGSSGRLHHFHRLHVGDLTGAWDNRHSELGAKAVRLLVQILEEAKNIQEVRIFKAEKLLRLDEKIPELLSGLTSVRSLYVSRPGVASFEVIANLQSPVVVLDMDPPSFRHRHDPIPLLKNFQSSLGSLTWRQTMLESTEAQFPQLRTLNVTTEELLDVGPMMRAFPNVQNFNIRTEGEHFISEALVERRRAENLETQKKASLENRWKGLDRLGGSVGTLYSLGVVVPVRQLSIYHSTEGHIAWFRKLLVDVTPVTLFLEISGNEVEMEDLLEFAAPRLVHLVVSWTTFDARNIDRYLQTKTLEMLKKLNIQYLKVIASPPISQRHQVEDGFDYRTFAEEVVKVVASICFISLFRGNRHPSYWKVTELDGGDRQLSEADSDTLFPGLIAEQIKF